MSLKFRYLGAVAFMFAGLMAAPGSAGFDLAGSFSGASSLSDIQDWSFGKMSPSLDASTFQPFQAPGTLYSNEKPVVIWHGSEAYPTILFNSANNQFVINSGSTYTSWDPNQVAFHPSSNGDLAVLRYTAPTSGDYGLFGAVQGIDSGMGIFGNSDGVEFLIRHNSVLDGTQSIISPQVINTAFQPFNFVSTLSLVAGETVDFLLGKRENYNHDGTGLSATFSYLGPSATVVHAPEPATAVMVISALAVFGGGRRLSRRRQVARGQNPATAA